MWGFDMLLYSGDTPPELNIRPCEHETANRNPYGLKNAQ